MPKQVRFEGKIHQFPDDATPDEIRQALGGSTEKRETPSTAGFLKNIPASAGRLIFGVAEAVTSPIQTARGVGKIAAGAVESAAPETFGSSDVEAWDAVKNMLRERYGSYDALLKTAYEDPAGVGADLAALLSGGGGALRGAGAVTGVSKLSTTGRALERTAAVVDPIQTMGRAAVAAGKPVVETAGKVATGLVGGTTGAGAESFRMVIETAKRGTTAQQQALKGAMRGRISEMDVLGNVITALQEARDIRGANYQAKLAQIKNVKAPLDMQPIQKSVANGLKDFKVRTEIYAKGNIELDFSRSPIRNPAAQAEIREIVQTVEDWGTKADDLTPLGMDTLKRRVADVYSETSQARAFSERVGTEIRHQLTAKVPGYSEMTKEYAAASELIETVTRELSLGSKNPGAAIRKLQYALKQNNNYRKFLVESLENFSGNETLKQQLAGTVLSRATPRGIVGEMAAAGIIAGTVFGTLKPHLIVSLAAHSPRVMGELAIAIAEMQKLATSPTIRSVVRPLATPGVYRPLQLPGVSGIPESTK